MRFDLGLLKAILANAGALIVVLDRKGRIRLFNRAAEELSGRSFEEVEGKTPWETVLPPEVAEQAVRGAWDRWLSDQRAEATLFTNEWLTASGERRLIEWSNTLLLDAEGGAEFLVSVGTDISERAHAQAALVQSRQTLRAVFDSMPIFALVFDTEGRTVELTESILAICTLDRASALGRFAWEFPGLGHSEDSRRFARDAVRHAAAGEVVRGDLTAKDESGRVRAIDTIWAPVRNESGEVVQVVASGVDVTERRAAERALKENERRLLEAQRLAALGSWDLDLRTNELIWSEEIFRIFEIDEGEFGASYEAFLELVHPDDRARVNEAYSRSVEERASYRLEHRLLFPDGRIKWVEERGTTEHGDEGPLRSTGTVQDITERKRQRAELERALAEQETLLRELHHRVRNNLLIISGFLFFEKSRTEEPAALAVLDGLEQRLSAMTLAHEKLFQAEGVARLELGQYLSTLARHIVDSTGLAAKGVELELDFDTIELDMDRALPLGMMLSELLTNAGKHAFPEGRGGRLTVRLEVEGDMLALSVADDGVGFQDEPVAGSDSFGWRLIRRFEEQLGADVSVHSNGGTEVVVRLPLAAPRSPRAG